MADYVPDAQPGPSWDGDSGDVAPEGPETTAQHSDSNDQNQQLEDTSAANGDTEDAADYDPESVPITADGPDSNPLKPSPQPVAKKPRTAGGFLVGDSDDSDDDNDDGSTAPEADNAPESRSTPTLLHPASAQHVNSAEPPAPSSRSPSAQAQAETAPAGADLQGSNGTHASAVQTAVHYDPVALMESRVKEDPRGALDAWQFLMGTLRQRGDIEECRGIYERFLAVFPQAAEIWVRYAEMELANSNFVQAEAIFNKSLLSVPSVELWTVYLDYIRRRNDLNDPTGRARTVVGQAYEFVVGNVGIDQEAGRIWSDYIQFMRSAPGVIGGTAWQDQQKMDQLRKTFQRAICIPLSNVNNLWKEYDQFEKGLNPANARKFLNEHSPAYMTAKSANTALDNLTRNLIRRTLPRLPPAPGFDGDQEWADQVDLWKRWIRWEREDPLDLATDEPQLLQKRILYVYQQALMALRFWPEIWVDAAEWCFENNVVVNGKDMGLSFLTEGIEANPESVLLALKHADRIETTHPVEEGDAAKIARGSAVKAPYSKVLDTLYAKIKSLKEKEKAEIAKIRESMPEAPTQKPDDEDIAAGSENPPVDENQEKIATLEKGFAAQTELLARTVSFVWIALARAMRRIQGKGNPTGAIGGMRQIFSEARQKGRLTSDVYIAMAQMEWTVYKDPAGAKIFERGAKLFPEDEYFMLEYIKFLHSRDDFTNARVVFETCVNKLTQQPALVPKSKPLYSYFHRYESKFGELSQVAKLEKRMAELFPDDPKLFHFAQRFVSDRFDPIAARIIISPAVQLRPKLVLPSIESGNAGSRGSPQGGVQSNNRPHSPRPHFLSGAGVNSPKRPFPADDFDDSANLPPKKIQRGGGNGDQRDFQRGESPLKGAAGRRLDQQRRMGGGSSHHHSAAAAPPPIPRDVNIMLSLLPGAEAYNVGRLKPTGLVGLLRDTHVPDYMSWKARQDQVTRGGGAGAPHHRHASSDFANAVSGYGRRDSPGRTGSPFGDRRLASASNTYHLPLHRPDSRGDSYEPPPPANYHLPPTQDVPHFASAPGQGYDGASVPPGTWPPPPHQQPQAYAAPSFQQPPQPGYGTYRY